MKNVDCRNMACPMPVVTVKRALEEADGEQVRVLLDAGAPRENVARFARNRGFSVEESAEQGGYSLLISGSQGEGSPEKAGRKGDTVMLVASDRLGDGPEELGRLLMKNFIITLLDLPAPPDRIFFLNTGVFLTTEGSEVLEALNRLGDMGVEVFSCGVCLDFFNRRELLMSGGVTNMFSIAEGVATAASVIRI